MKQTIFAVAALAIAAAVPAQALVTDGIPTTTRATYNLAQAYPCTVATYPTIFPGGVTTPTGVGISDLRIWCGAGGDLLHGSGHPGILALARKGNFLDVNCFVVKPGDNYECFVQAYRLIKEVPGSFKCPDVYGLPHFDADGILIPYRYFQYGTGVRTWWSLNFTQPGTQFILEVVSVCRTKTVTTEYDKEVIVYGPAQVKRDRWVWRVVANTDTLRNLIDLMHGGAVSTLEVPCILAEDMYDALVAAHGRLDTAVDSGNLTDIGNAIFDFEALIVANCLFVEVLNPLVTFPGAPQFGAPNIQPPGNLAQTVFFGQGSAVAGIIDTIEHPCCCKLLVDLEWITLRAGIIGQTPKLPTF